MCHAIYEKYNLLIFKDYLHYGREISVVCITGLPTKKNIEVTIRQFFVRKEWQRQMKVRSVVARVIPGEFKWILARLPTLP